MPRKLVPTSSDLPYFITARCHNREWFSLPIEVVWEIVSDYLFYINKVYDARIFSFVLMSNHFHMLARFPDANMSVAMQYFMRQISRIINDSSGHINQVFGGRYHRSLIDSPLYFLHAYKYTYRNPVEARICRAPEDYPYSTLHAKLGGRHCIIPYECDETLFNDIDDSLQWLNLKPTEKNRSIVKTALSKSKFSLISPKKKGNRHNLEFERY